MDVQNQEGRQHLNLHALQMPADVGIIQFMERILHEAGNDEAWVCICRNTPSGSGFYPCDRAGREIEPTEANAWSGLYLCLDCGRIIDQKTLEVVGKCNKPQLVS